MQWRFFREAVITKGLFLCACLSILTTLGIIWILVSESTPFFREVSPFAFLFGREWTPLFEPKAFGVLPLIAGSLLIAFGSSIIAIPLGVACAIYLSEYASERMRSIVKPVLEVLTGIPTVVYGYFAISFVTPLLQKIYEPTQIFNAASASIVVGIMILPMIASLSDDAMRSVPNSLRHAAHSLGSTKLETSLRIVLPAALSGVTASFILAISRAVGETMAVTLAAGATPKLTANFMESIQTMTAYIVQVSLGDTPAGTVEYHTIFAVGLMLFAITFMMNIAAQFLLARLREQYE